MSFGLSLLNDLAQGADDGVAIRAAHSCGCRMAAGKARAAREPRRNGEPDRPGNKRGGALDGGARRIGPRVRQGQTARGPQRWDM